MLRIRITDQIDHRNAHLFPSVTDGGRVRGVSARAVSDDQRAANDGVDAETWNKIDTFLEAASKDQRQRLAEILNEDQDETTDDDDPQDLEKSRAVEERMVEEGSLRASDVGRGLCGREAALERAAADSRRTSNDTAIAGPVPAGIGHANWVSRSAIDSRRIGGGQ